MGKKAVKQTYTICNKYVSPVRFLLPSDKISNGISSLLEALPNSLEMPRFNSATDTIYLQLATEMIEQQFMPGRPILPNPLSYNRSVCVIASLATRPQSFVDKLTAAIKKIGITGNISVVAAEKVKEWIDAQNDKQLSKLTKSSDMFLVDKRLLPFTRAQPLLNKMNRLGKHVHVIRCVGKGVKYDMKDAMCTSLIFPNSTYDAYLWRVGHRAMSVSEIHANVIAVLNTLSRRTKWFSEGLSKGAVRLGNAAGAAVDLYIDPGDAVPCNPHISDTQKEICDKAENKPPAKRAQRQQAIEAGKVIKAILAAEPQIPSEILNKISEKNKQRKKAFISQETMIEASIEPPAKRKKVKAILTAGPQTPAEILAKKAENKLQRMKALALQRELAAQKAVSVMVVNGLRAILAADIKERKKKARALQRELPKIGTTMKADANSPVTAEIPEEDCPLPAKKLKIAPHSLTSTTSSSANSLSSVGASRATTGQETEISSVQVAAPQTVSTPKSPLVIVSTNSVTPAGTPGSGKKRKLPHNNTPVTDGSPVPTKERFTAPNTPLMVGTPLKAETPGSVAVQGSVNDSTPAGTPGSAKKRRRSRNKGTPATGTPDQTKNTPLKATTPLKAETPLKIATPVSASVLTSVNDSTPAGTPGSAKKRRRSRNKGTPATGTPDQAKNTPLKAATPLKAETPLKVDTSLKATTPLMSEAPVKVETPLQIVTPGSVAVVATVNGGTFVGTPGSGKKRKQSQSKDTPNSGKPNQAKEKTPLFTKTPVMVETPLKIATPGSAAVLASANGGTPAGTPGSAKKRRRSRNKGTPGTGMPNEAKENTPLKADTPMSMQKTPLKENTPIIAKPITPTSNKVPVLGDGVSPVVTPGSGKKRRRSRKNGTPVTVGTPGPAKENTPFKEATPIVAQPTTPIQPAATPGKVITPGSGGKKRRTRQSLLPKTPALAVGTPGNANTPGSGGKKRRTRQSLLPTTPAVLAATPGTVNTPDSGSKKRRTRRSVLPGTPGVATPGADGKKSPGIKVRLRQRASMGIGKN